MNPTDIGGEPKVDRSPRHSYHRARIYESPASPPPTTTMTSRILAPASPTDRPQRREPRRRRGLLVRGGPSLETKWGPIFRLTEGPTNQILAYIVQK
jgi:hypothetical protein